MNDSKDKNKEHSDNIRRMFYFRKHSGDQSRMFAECSVLAGLTLIVRTGRLKLRVRVYPRVGSGMGSIIGYGYGSGIVEMVDPHTVELLTQSHLAGNR